MVANNSVDAITGIIICFGILTVTIIAILGALYRLKLTKQFQQNQANGLYKDWNKPTILNRIGLLIILEFIFVFGILAWLITGFNNSQYMFSFGRIIIFILLFIVGISGGTVLRRMLAKGK